MESICPFASTLADAIGQEFGASPPPGAGDIPLMPLGQAADMGHAPDGTPLIDPRLFSSAEYNRNPYPYFRILRDHYPVFHDALHNCYYVTRFDDVKACAAPSRPAAPSPRTPPTTSRCTVLGYQLDRWC